MSTVATLWLVLVLLAVLGLVAVLVALAERQCDHTWYAWEATHHHRCADPATHPDPHRCLCGETASTWPGLRSSP